MLKVSILSLLPNFITSPVGIQKAKRRNLKKVPKFVCIETITMLFKEECCAVEDKGDKNRKSLQNLKETHFHLSFNVQWPFAKTFLIS